MGALDTSRPTFDLPTAEPSDNKVVKELANEEWGDIPPPKLIPQAPRPTSGLDTSRPTWDLEEADTGTDAPGMMETAGRSFAEGLAPGVLDTALAAREAGGLRDPSQPFYQSGNQAARAKYLAQQAGEPFGFDQQRQEQYEQNVIAPGAERQAARRQAGAEANPITAGISEVAGGVAPYLVPIPGARAAKLGSRLATEGARAATVAGMQSDEPVGSDKWFVDVGFGAVAGAGGGAVANLTTKFASKIGTNAEKGMYFVAKNAARRIKAKERVQMITAMRTKYQGNAKIKAGLPFLAKSFEKIDKAVMNKMIPAKTGKGLVSKPDNIVKKNVQEMGLKVAKAYDAVGGSSSITTALLLTTIGVPFVDITMDDIGKGFIGVMTAGAYANFHDRIVKAPEQILDIVGGKWGKRLRPLLKLGEDAFRAGLIYAAQHEDFKRALIDHSMGEGAYDRIEETEILGAETQLSGDESP